MEFFVMAVISGRIDGALGVSKLEYKYLTRKSVETWYCSNCKKSMFPFFDLDYFKLAKLLCTKKKLTIKATQSQQTDANITIRNKMCCL